MEYGVLFISPHGEDAGILSKMLSPLSIPLEHAEDFQQARQKLERERYDVVLTEADLPDGSWVDVLNFAGWLNSPSAVIVTHPFADDRLWAEVLNLGGYDLLAQPFYISEVQRILSNACLHISEKKVAHAAL